MPAYLPGGYSQATPGQRFGPFFRIYGSSHEWPVLARQKDQALGEVTQLTAEHRELVHALRRRQFALVETQRTTTGQEPLVRDVVGEAPCVTGMGMEHPVENGFAFLWPYGLPYLPGSSVKGVVRRAAEELALFGDGESGDWTIPTVWWLFGLDASSAFFRPDSKTDPDALREERERWKAAYLAHLPRCPEDLVRALIGRNARLSEYADSPQRLLTDLVEAEARGLREALRLRGSLLFWDVIPDPPAGTGLRMDIMNPHHGDYYQKGKPPGDWESPTPVYYLTLPPDTGYRFIATIEPIGGLPDTLRESWHSLLDAALAHAFEWLGFGAKTSLGYGLMGPEKKHAKGERAATAGTRPAGGTVHRTPADEQIEKIRALPKGGRAAGSIAPYIQWCLDRPEDPDGRRVARAIVECMGRKWVTRKAKDQQRWAQIVRMARNPGERDKTKE